MVITLQEHEGDCLDSLRRRIHRENDPIRRMGADYLVYAIIDAVIDSYFPILESVRDAMTTEFGWKS